MCDGVTKTLDIIWIMQYWMVDRKIAIQMEVTMPGKVIGKYSEYQVYIIETVCTLYEDKMIILLHVFSVMHVQFLIFVWRAFLA